MTAVPSRSRLVRAAIQVSNVKVSEICPILVK